MRSIAGRLAWLLLATAIAATAVTLVAATLSLRASSRDTANHAESSASEAIDRTLAAQATTILRVVSEHSLDAVVSYDFAALKKQCENLLSIENVGSVAIYDADEVLLADGSTAPALRKVRLAPGTLKTANTIEERGAALWASEPLLVNGKIVGWAQVSLDLKPREHAQRTLRAQVERGLIMGERALFQTSLGIAVLLVMLAAGGAFLVARQVTKPVLSLRRATARVAEGDLNVRVTIHSRDELGELANAFNAMIQELAEARRAQHDQARMARELEIASSIQSALLPQTPIHPELEFAGVMKPADEVGGDFYDVLGGGGESSALWITIGDVSGHGLPAGLVMLMAQSAFASMYEADSVAEPAKVIERVNAFLYMAIAGRMHDSRYLTAQLLCYRGQGRFEFAGAHTWPFVYRSERGACDQIPVDGPWLGILPTLDNVPSGELVLSDGDVLCLYSDGLIEAMNAQEEQYECERLSQSIALAVAREPSLAEAAKRIVADVLQFAPVQQDDITLLLVRRRSK